MGRADVGGWGREGGGREITQRHAKDRTERKIWVVVSGGRGCGEHIVIDSGVVWSTGKLFSRRRSRNHLLDRCSW